MKRIVISAIISIFAICQVFAEHEYIPFIGYGKEWVELSPPSTPRVFQFTIGATTQIEGVTYYELLQRIFSPWEDPMYYDGETQYIREKDSRVYLYRNNTEELIYDFNLGAGDTAVSTGHNGEYTIHVDSVKVEQWGEKERNVYYVWYEWEYSSEYDKLTERWVEGIGSTSYSIYTFSSRYGQSGVNRFYYYHESATGYSYPADASLIDFSSVAQLRNDNAIAREGSRLTAQGNITLFDTNGRLVATGTTIDLGTLPRGIYIARCSLSDSSTLTRKVVW